MRQNTNYTEFIILECWSRIIVIHIHTSHRLEWFVSTCSENLCFYWANRFIRLSLKMLIDVHNQPLFLFVLCILYSLLSILYITELRTFSFICLPKSAFTWERRKIIMFIDDILRCVADVDNDIVFFSNFEQNYSTLIQFTNVFRLSRGRSTDVLAKTVYRKKNSRSPPLKGFVCKVISTKLFVTIAWMHWIEKKTLFLQTQCNAMCNETKLQIAIAKYDFASKFKMENCQNRNN